MRRSNGHKKTGIEKAFADIHEKLGSRLAGVVLDLRNNPGGLLDQSLVLSDSFLNEGEIVSIRGRNPGRDRSHKAVRGDLAKGAPMVVLMILAMGHMFASKAANIALIAASLVAFFGSFALIRTQTTIGDTAFLRSMIPHHSGAILMCQEAKLSDPEVIRLCESIKRSQRQEIDEMKAILARR